MEMYLQHLCNEYRNSIEVAEFLSKDIIATINNRENDEKVIKYIIVNIIYILY